MINFSVSRPLRALTFQRQAKKTKTILFLSFSPNFGSVEAASRNSSPLFRFHADVRRL